MAWASSFRARVAVLCVAVGKFDGAWFFMAKLGTP